MTSTTVRSQSNKPETHTPYPIQKTSILAIAAMLAIAVLGATTASAQEIWSGSGLSFTKADFADHTQAANQDRITGQTWITRASSMGIFNIFSEASFTNPTSPANTEWAYDLAGNGNTGLTMTAANHAALSFETWVNAVNNGPPSAVNLPGVLHLISEDIYIDIEVTSWTQMANGGGFSYQRGTPPPDSVPSVDARGLTVLTLAVLGLGMLAMFPRRTLAVFTKAKGS